MLTNKNCALKLVDEIILYYDARSKKHQITKEIVKVTELSCDRSLQQMFRKMDMIECYFASCKEYPRVSEKTVKFCWHLAQHNIVNVDFLHDLHNE